jgi:hypothetical protein
MTRVAGLGAMAVGFAALAVTLDQTSWAQITEAGEL